MSMPRAATYVLLALLNCGASAHDYPTVDRVQYVDSCIRSHPQRHRQEMIYKCSCAIDALAQQWPYEEFVEASTAFNAGQTAGERGTQIRESAIGQDLTARYRASQAEAYRRCLIQE